MELARMVGKSGKVTAADLQEGMLDIVPKKKFQVLIFRIFIEIS